MSNQFIQALDHRVDEILEACTACGACVDVCPTPAAAGFKILSAEETAAGVLEILRHGAGPQPSEQWADACCGTGACLNVCAHGINPRFMLAMAQRALRHNTSETNRRESGKSAFKKMSRGVYVLSRLTMPPELLARLNPSIHGEGQPDLVFYTGCNMLRTPHIGLICLDILDKLGVRYEVYGGPANCCGILQMRPGDTENAGRQGEKTLERFGATKTAEVLSWCPTCQIQFSETVMPNDLPDFGMTMFPVYLSRRLPDLKPHMTTKVAKRVALMEFPGAPGVVDAVNALLAEIDGLEVVTLDTPRIGYQMTSLRAMPKVREQLLADTLREAEEKKVDMLASVFHADHRELSAHENAWPFEIVNYMDILGASMGIEHADVFKRLKLMQDVDAIIASSQEMIETYDLDIDEVREIVANDMLGDQFLSVDRSLHPAP